MTTPFQMVSPRWRFRCSVFCAVVGLASGSMAQAAPPIPDTLDLETSIRYAVENNYAIRQARERIREQEGLIVEVKGRVLPNVSLNSLYSRDADSLTPAGNCRCVSSSTRGAA